MRLVIEPWKSLSVDDVASRLVALVALIASIAGSAVVLSCLRVLSFLFRSYFLPPPPALQVWE